MKLSTKYSPGAREIMLKESVLQKAGSAVNILLNQYKNYLAVQAKIDALDGEKMAAAADLARRENLKLSEVLKDRRAYPVFVKINSEEKRLREKLQDASDAMTFANPVIWMMYKHLAYQGTGSAILTLRDMRKHCSKPDYICSKRFQYLNAYLKKQKNKDLENTESFPDRLKMPEIYESDLIMGLTAEKEFMSGWEEREYYKAGGRIAKWENHR